jgi:low affinity Fe/Cu permease
MKLFDRFAERASHVVSGAWFFAFCLLLVLVWLPSLPLFGSLDTWQLVINTATTIVTFLLVALLQNSQWRATEATNRKLNAIADGLAATMDSLSEVMAKQSLDDHRERMLAQADDLRETVGLERRVSPGQNDRSGPGTVETERALNTGT